jgi:hypothetical protein
VGCDGGGVADDHKAPGGDGECGRARLRVVDRMDGGAAHDEIGGRVGSVELDGVSVDTGPTTLVLPVVFDSLFRLAGSSLEHELTSRTLL